ncbi:MAG: hypothetical protein HN348_02000 [Proteobacteria bacterium]|jgi:protease IV|nr:hypothetical protein [Pseudomonadota bacterium]
MLELFRIFVGVLIIPIVATGTFLHNWLTGRKAILEVEISHGDDLLQRQVVNQRLRRAAVNPRIAAVILRLDGAPGSWAACQDLRDVVLRLKKAGKAVYAFLDAPGNAQVWIASACDQVFIVPTGEVSLVGIGGELMFLGQALSRLGIEADLEAAGAYKSFGETYKRSFASPENQEAVRALVFDLHRMLLEGIGDGRGIEEEVLAELIERAPLGARECEEVGLVDQLAYEDELEDWVVEKHGKGSRIVRFASWAGRDAALQWVSGFADPAKTIAVVHLEGPIVMDNRGMSATVRARKVVPILRKLRKDDDVRAVVLHVNSPGGSALASDLIWREVDLLTKEKTVVASFEDRAASGGFYLAAPAHEIIARPGTLTGSIGVFGGKLVMREGLRKLGVVTQEINAAPNSSLFSPTRRFTDSQRRRFRDLLERFYDGFVSRVAAGRKRPVEDVEPHCRGRVWTGRAALELGLVDGEGDLFHAVERARVLAELPLGTYARSDIATWPRRTLFSKLLTSVLRGTPMGSSIKLLDRLVKGPLSPLVDVMLAHDEKVLAILPFEIDLK